MTSLRALVPLLDPSDWAQARARGRGAAAVLAGPDPSMIPAVRRLADAGARALGRISLGYASRPLPDVLDEITTWAALAVQGIFFDHAPSGPYQVGPVAHAVRAARRAGLSDLVLNAGMPVDPIYRGLGATVCTFEGTCTEYRARPGDEFGVGDGHLVLAVPAAELAFTRGLVLARRADLFLVTERAEVFAPGCPGVHNG